MQILIARLFTFIVFIFIGFSASAQTRNEGEACLQAVQSSADALSVGDWVSLISLKKQQLKSCWWDSDPAIIADANSTIGVAHYMLRDLNNAKIAFTKCVESYYSEPNCHYWLAVIASKNKDFKTSQKEKEIAEKIARRIISEGMPTYTNDEVMITRFRARIEVAKIVLQKLDEFK